MHLPNTHGQSMFTLKCQVILNIPILVKQDKYFAAALNILVLASLFFTANEGWEGRREGRREDRGKGGREGGREGHLTEVVL